MLPRSVLVLCVAFVCTRGLRTDKQYWLNLAKNELNEALEVKLNYNTAKNVILFVGDGMGPNTVTATRIYKGGESHRLVYEKFPHVGLLKTYAANKMVPDSACTATAMFCGIKSNKDTVGVDASVKPFDCNASLKTEARPQSLAAVALNAGKSAGFVTTARVTHATPGPMYAHTASRYWECDGAMPPGAESCKDTARQLVEDFPGRDLHVVMGGGKQSLVTNVTKTPDDPLDDLWGCLRKDGRNLIQDYKDDKSRRGLNYRVVTDNEELKNLNIENTDYLFGVFANSHLSFEDKRNKGPKGMPSLSDMVAAAIKVLRKNENGYFLMVEGASIDLAHHNNWAKRAIIESAAMEEAVELAANMTDEADTLLIVTSDHQTTLSINGYPNRGSNIFDIAGTSEHDGINYTTLFYASGGPESHQYYVNTDKNGTKALRRDPSKDDVQNYEYSYQSGIALFEGVHGGGEVAIYARGPYSHLFHNVHEQHYVFHAISYAAKIGEYAKNGSQNTKFIFNLLYISLVCHIIL
ncbi:unnamed protein product [Arctia plantaginis]|uniref:Alkaline phosphatase n=1 Tax=Arctia plantaginis TaxID=874455 RepID=A0A8S0Z7K6_ARCPL|nr:unnamed protein product [Arctia plantaginis]CAB3228260.1 unnamed protein product [Arctia plantaginis]